MDRVLTFDSETGKKHFSNCYQALVISPYLKANAERDFDTKRLERNIHRAMKKISELVPADQPESFYEGRVQARRLVAAEAPQVILSQPEHTLLKKWVENFPWGGGQPVEDGVETAEWLDAAEKR
jgi:hypothetical protein